VDFRKAYDTLILRPRVMSMGHARYTYMAACSRLLPIKYVLRGFLTNQDVAEVGGPLPEHHMCEPREPSILARDVDCKGR
jgi:hypothetical protein